MSAPDLLAIQDWLDEASARYPDPALRKILQGIVDLLPPAGFLVTLDEDHGRLAAAVDELRGVVETLRMAAPSPRLASARALLSDMPGAHVRVSIAVEMPDGERIALEAPGDLERAHARARALADGSGP